MNLKDFSVNAVVTFFGSGYLRPMSATWGSFTSGLVLFSFWPFLDQPIKLGVILTTFILGVKLSDYVEQRDKVKDPKHIVIDEVVGMMIVTFFLDQVWLHWLIAFLLFRVFDVAKLWPASVYDQKRGGFALMIDDVIMAIPALFLVQIIIFTLL
ncbi:MAG: phosphatidylglycerophosphatase A [Candidatus Altimarinota bacterium]